MKKKVIKVRLYSEQWERSIRRGGFMEANRPGFKGGRAGAENLFAIIATGSPASDHMPVAERLTFHHNSFVADHGVAPPRQTKYPASFVHYVYGLDGKVPTEEQKRKVQEGVFCRRQRRGHENKDQVLLNG